MTNSNRRIGTPQYEQLTLFPESCGPSAPAPGSLDVGGRMRAALKAAIKACPRSRNHIAAAMSDALQHDISKAQLDSWTSPSHEGHRFPLEYVPAFCHATADHGLLDMLCELAGGSFVPGPQLLDLQLGQLAADEVRLRSRKKVLMDKLKKESVA